MLATLSLLAATQVRDLTRSSFDAALVAQPAFVKFYAPWCGHCRRLEPTWAELAETLPSVTVARVDATQEEMLGLRFGIKGFPTLIFFANATAMFEYKGPRSAEALAEFARDGFKSSTPSSVPGYAAIVLNIFAQLPMVFQELVQLFTRQFGLPAFSWSAFMHPAVPCVCLLLLLAVRLCCCGRPEEPRAKES